MLTTALFVVAVVALGTVTTLLADVHLLFEERLAIGAVVGLVEIGVLGLGTFLLLGMSLWTVAIPTAVLIGIAASGLRSGRRRLDDEWRSLVRRCGLRTGNSASARPVVLVTAASAAVSTRVLALAFQTTPSGVASGHLAVWGDWSAHLAYASSFAYGNNRGLLLPVASGETFRYHFLSDFLAGLLTQVGASVEQGLVVGTWVLAVAFPVLLFCVVRRLSASRAVALLTCSLFVLSGGLGFVRFFGDLRRGGLSILTRLPDTYTRRTNDGIWYDNTIGTQLYAQRSTQLGLCVLLAASLLLLVGRPARNRRCFAFAGILVGVSAIGHGQTVLTMGALALMALWWDRKRPWAFFVVPVAVLAAPMVVWLQPPTSAFRFRPGFMAPEIQMNWMWFWFVNLGVFAPLTLWTLVTDRRGSRTALARPLWLWFIVPNIVAFHPATWNNTKYFVYWQLAMCWVVSEFLVRWARTGGQSRVAGSTRGLHRFARAVSVGLLIAACTAGGALDTVRAMQRSSRIEWSDADGIAVAHWLRQHTPPEAVLVAAPENTSPMSALSGRPSVSGYPGWTWDLGLPDWATRRDASRSILQLDVVADALVRRYGVSYVVIGPAERDRWGADPEAWNRKAAPVFRRGTYSVYRVGSGSSD